MNQWNAVTAGVAVAAVVFVAQPSVMAKKGGTSILHFTTELTMAGTGIDTDAQGKISAEIKTQGNAEKQHLEINLANLDPNTTYQLQALIGEDTNLIEVVDFETDSSGAAVLDYSKQGQGKAKGKGHQSGGALPIELDPVSNITSLVIANGVAEVVLTSDFSTSAKLQYLVKRMLYNDGVDSDASASLRMKSNGNNEQFRLRVEGLDPSATYYLAVNEDVAQTLASDEKGSVDINNLPAGTDNNLEIMSLAIWNSASNSVLSTSLP